MKDLDKFTRKSDFLVCIDSDGTAIDSMTSKHRLCFGHCFIKEWGLEEHFDKVLRMWCDINLRGKTRGKNRFVTLYLILDKLNGSLVDEDLSGLKEWIETALQLSNNALENKEKKDKVLKKALDWSYAVNESISKLGFEDKAVFGGVKDFLEYAEYKADIAVVSSANFDSIKEEWAYYDLIKHVSVITSQENGTKSECIEQLAKKGYDNPKILMIGDAPSDLQSAKESGVLFYPIFPGNEQKNWEELKEKIFDKFLKNDYDETMKKLVSEFIGE